MDDDYYLIGKMKKGDDNSMELFIRKYYPEILKYCYRNLRGSNIAEDITQETFVYFVKSLNRYHHYGKARNYLYTIAGNLCKNQYKMRSFVLLEEQVQALEAAESDIETRLDMENALQKLSAEFREILILHYFQDLKLKEIARILEIGLPLVKYRLAKAKEKLKIIMEEEESSWT
jgi:RNA polymerase sigma factor, sigma-70 family